MDKVLSIPPETENNGYVHKFYRKKLNKVIKYEAGTSAPVSGDIYVLIHLFEGDNVLHASTVTSDSFFDLYFRDI